MNNKTDVGIIAAMEEEAAGLIARMENRSEEIRGSFTYHLGILDGKSVCLLQCGIGKVNAAVGTALMLNEWTPSYILNTGSAGGFNPELTIGDIVLSDEVLHHDADAVVFGYAPGQVPGMPHAYKGDRALLDCAAALRCEDSSVRLIRGTIASGDSFISREEQIQRIQTEFPGVDAAEMEAAAVAQSCHLFKTPFLIIRSISDVVGDEDNHMSFDEFLPVAARNSVDIVGKIIKSFTSGN
ncbi:MAG: 5'-methylthioadenosine/adenosylhomocysteine nucleosidase [Spirochaetales bacterium]|nr:5'-methylthioadenosine/adenosylhomocysteine nucleosidase [Spirochaetales bacterium]